MLTVTEISKENHVSCCENSKSSIMLLYPIMPCAANLALIMHHAENLGLITWHGKLGETQERTGTPQAAQTWGLRSSASSSPPAIWWPPYPLEGLLLEFFSEGVPLESWNSTTMPSTKIPKPSNFSYVKCVWNNPTTSKQCQSHSDDFQLVQRYSSDFHVLTKFVEC